MDAIDKIRNIAAWADWQNEHFNQKIKSVADLEKIYDYKEKEGLEYLDDPSYWDEDEEKHVNAIHKLLGYKIY